MSKKSAINFLVVSSMMNANKYNDADIDDQDVLDCLMDLYLYMLCIDVDDEKEEKFFKAFSEKYKKLNDEQKEIVKKDYFDLVEDRERNNENVKIKGKE